MALHRNGKILLSEAAKILKIGFQFGVDTIDTAAAYGNSEAVLGQPAFQTEGCDQVALGVRR